MEEVIEACEHEPVFRSIRSKIPRPTLSFDGVTVSVSALTRLTNRKRQVIAIEQSRGHRVGAEHRLAYTSSRGGHADGQLTWTVGVDSCRSVRRGDVLSKSAELFKHIDDRQNGHAWCGSVLGACSRCGYGCIPLAPVVVSTPVHGRSCGSRHPGRSRLVSIFPGQSQWPIHTKSPSCHQSNSHV